MSGKSPNICKLNHTLVNNQRVKGKLNSVLTGEDVEQQEHSFIADGNANGAPTLKDSLGAAYKLNILLAYDPVIMHLGIYLT